MAPKKPFSNRPWPDLPPEILSLIISSLPIQDRVRCRLVCRLWVEAERLKPVPRQLPWLMLSIRPDTSSQRFFSLTSTTMIQVKLQTESRETMCCGSIDGRLVFNDIYGQSFLLNPLSKSLTPLPRGLSCPRFIGDYNQDTPCFQRKVIFSSPPDTASDDCHVAAICDRGMVFHGWKYMNDWVIKGDVIEDILFVQTNLLAISIDEKVYTSVLTKSSGFRSSVWIWIEARVRQEYDLQYKKHAYLVQFPGSRTLVMVLRYYEGEGSDKSTVMFKVYELVQNPNELKWVEKNSLDGNVIFLSSSCSRAIPASNFEGLEEDKIYFADEIRYANGMRIDSYECGDIGVFSLKDGSITRLVENKVNLSDSPPVWFFSFE